MSKIEIYTDGACYPNPGRGGWAFLIAIEGEEYSSHSGGSHGATNNTMEMTAAIKALEWLRGYPGLEPKDHVVIYTDSKYLILGITKWIKSWQARNWLTKERMPVKNKDLWQTMAHLISKQVHWKWVRGHSENKFNCIVDEMAVHERRSLKQG